MMKQLLHLSFLLACFLSGPTALQAQSNLYNEDNKAALRNFLRQQSGTAGEKNINKLWDGPFNSPADTLNWEKADYEAWVEKIIGLTWEETLTDSCLFEIKWANFSLAGNLDLSNCTYLQLLHCHNNKLAGVDIGNNINLSELNCSNNAIPLSQLYKITSSLSSSANITFDTQGPVLFDAKPMRVNEMLDLSSEKHFGGGNTRFDVKKSGSQAFEGIDYKIAEGFILFLQPGSYTIEMENDFVKDSYNQGLAISGTIMVSANPQSEATGISIPTSAIISQWGNDIVVPQIKPVGATYKNLTWTSSNPAIAIVDANGTITGINPGETKIKVQMETGSNSFYSNECNVVVSTTDIPVTGISIHPVSLTMGAGGTEILAYTILPTNATHKEVVWSSSNPSIATVDNNGRVKAHTRGTAYITATTADGRHYATCNLSVQSQPIAVSGIFMNRQQTEISYNSDEILMITITPSNATGKGIVWSSSDPSIATVGSDGKVTATGTGTVLISATLNGDDGIKAHCIVDVVSTASSVTGVSINKSTQTIKKGHYEMLTAIISPANADNKTVTWTSNNPSVATVDPNSGKVTAIEEGRVVITVTTADGNYYAACIIQVITVATGVTLSESALTMEVGNRRTLTETVIPDNAVNKNVTWLSNTPSVATVDDRGNVTAIDVGTATITVTTEDGNFTADCFVTVNPKTFPVKGIVLEKTTLVLEEGQSETLNAIIRPYYATNLTVSWASDDTDVAIVDNKGMVTAIKEGTSIITVTTEDGGYTATCTVTVNAPVNNETVTAGRLLLYPNPIEAGGNLNLQLPVTAEYADIRIYNTGGILIAQYDNVTGSISAPGEKGLYFIYIKLSDETLHTIRIMVK